MVTYFSISLSLPAIVTSLIVLLLNTTPILQVQIQDKHKIYIYLNWLACCRSFCWISFLIKPKSFMIVIILFQCRPILLYLKSTKISLFKVCDGFSPIDSPFVIRFDMFQYAQIPVNFIPTTNLCSSAMHKSRKDLNEFWCINKSISWYTMCSRLTTAQVALVLLHLLHTYWCSQSFVVV